MNILTIEQVINIIDPSAPPIGDTHWMSRTIEPVSIYMTYIDNTENMHMAAGVVTYITYSEKSAMLRADSRFITLDGGKPIAIHLNGVYGNAAKWVYYALSIDLV